ncbi:MULTISPECIES: acetate uptake transporter [Kribbella]|uniref:Acetate uptake transporter n=1 Tax=Kribbella karoonensis TaxID=324851 RepID=A0ABN2EHM2_9ACTN
MADTEQGSVVQAQGTAVEAPAPQQIDPGAHIADPAPLGLAGFAMTTFVLSVFNAKLISNTTLEAVVLPLALFYGGIGQFMAGMWEFRKGNTFGALAFSSFGAFWLSFAAYVKFVAPGLGANASTATGLFLLAWTIFTAYMTLAAARVNAAVLAVFVFLTLTYLFLTIGEFGTSATMSKIGGWLGLVTAVVAWYTSFAGVTNFTWKRTVLPVFPLSPAPHR